MKVLFLLIIMSASCFAWPWKSPQGTLGLYLESSYQNSDEKFSDGTYMGYNKGDAQPYFGEQPGEYTTLTIYASASYMLLDRLQITLATQWSNVTWDRAAKIEKNGIKEWSTTASTFFTLGLPFKIYGGWLIPNDAQHTTNINTISISDGIHTPFIGVSTGHILFSKLYLFTSHTLNIPLEHTTTDAQGVTLKTNKPTLWTSSTSAIYPLTDTYEVSLSYSTGIPFGKTSIEQDTVKASVHEYEYHTVSIGAGHKVGPAKLQLVLAQPIAGVEIPTGTQIKFSIGASLFGEY